MDLFLLHGALGASQQFDALADVLSRSFRVHRFDFEGHGSSTTTRPFRIQHFGDNVIDVMNRTSIASAVFFGYSMGGYVALHLAATRHHLVHAVATLGTKFRWDPETAAPADGRPS
jgi:pimeloyl-ACP methyl ester carboxylesterase